MLDVRFLVDTVNARLADEIDVALTEMQTAPVIAHLDLIVQQRTDRGEFLPGSAPDARRYRSSSHKKRRQKRGLPIDRVTLSLDGDMRRGTRGRTSGGAGELVIEYGYIEGESEARATELASYHQIHGAGRGGPVRKFIGVTREEEDHVVEQLRRLFGQALGD